MNNKSLGFVVIMVFLAAPVTTNAQVTTLDYQGSIFTNVSVSGNGSFPDVPTLSSIVGDVVLSAPLGANLNDVTLVPTAFSFNAPLLNSDLLAFPCCGNTSSFAFTTNNVRAITGWNIDLSFTFVGTNSPSGNSIVLGTSGDSYTGFGSTPSGCAPTGGCSLFIQESNTTPGVWSVAQKAPEIDPASAASGLTLLLGGLAVMRGRRASRRPSS
jgi:hypothetical protein